MDKVEIIKLLFKYGWTFYSKVEDAINNIDDFQLGVLKKLYAAFHGLSSLGDVLYHLNEPRFCKHPDTMQIGSGNSCRWPDGNITWDVVQVPNTIEKQRFVEAITEGFSRWARVAGIKPQYTPGNPSARIAIMARSIDGQMGVLAESELPCGNVKQCRQWYDLERWGVFDGPTGDGDLDITRVVTHELGHALGMNHIGAGNLMAPTYSRSIWLPQAGDIAEMVARYGNPTTQDPAPGGGGLPVGENYILRFTGGKLSVDGYRLTKLMEAA